VRTPQLLTRAGVDIPDVLSRWLDQVMPRGLPGAVLAVETYDVRNGGGLQPLGLELCRALRWRQGLRLKEIIMVVPMEARRCARRPRIPSQSPTAIYWSHPAIARSRHPLSVVFCSVAVATPARAQQRPLRKAVYVLASGQHRVVKRPMDDVTTVSSVIYQRCSISL
jgi:hypothetical protein